MPTGSPRSARPSRLAVLTLTLILTAGLTPAHATHGVHELVPTASGAGDRVGHAVAVSWQEQVTDGDRIVIGAPRSGDHGYDSGAVTVWRRDGQSWVEEARLTAPDSGYQAGFGSSVAIFGDRIVVGAPWGPNDSQGGRVYIFRRQETSWVIEQILTPPYGTDGNFGASVALSGATLVVGAPYTDVWFRKGNVIRHLEAGGVVNVYAFTGGTWSHRDDLFPEDASSYGRFGSRIAADLNRVVVSDRYETPDEDTQPRLSVFTVIGGTWSRATLTSPAGDPFYFGYDSVDIDGNIVVASDRGAAHVFRRTGPTWTPTTLTAADGDPTYGRAVSLAATGYAQETLLAIGASGANTTEVLASSGGQWRSLHVASGPDGGEFGSAVAVAPVGDVVVGAPWADGAGRAYAFQPPQDADGDGIGDYAELRFQTNPDDEDTDDDGVSDGDEVWVHGSDPHDQDTDGDLHGDRTEVDGGSSPIDPCSVPYGVSIPDCPVSEMPVTDALGPLR